MFLMTGDWHIGAAINRQGSDSIRDSGLVLDALLHTVQEMEIKYIIAAGDIFHRSRLKKEEINLFREFIDKITAENCRLMYIPGNHEKESQQEGVPLPSAVNPEAMDITGLWELEGLRIQGIPEGPPDTVRESLKNIGQCDLLVLHTAFKHLFSLDQTALVPEDIPESAGNVLAGHIHTVNKAGGLPSGGYIFSPGPLHATRIDEMGDVGGWAAEDPVKGDSWQWVPVTSQRIETQEVYPDSSCDQICGKIEQIRDEHQESIPVTINLKYTPDRRKDLSYIIHSFREHDDVRFTRTIVQETPEEDSVTEEIPQGEGFTRDVESAFSEEVQEDDQEVREFLYPLIHSNNDQAREYIRNWLKEQNVEKISV